MKSTIKAARRDEITGSVSESFRVPQDTLRFHPMKLQLVQYPPSHLQDGPASREFFVNPWSVELCHGASLFYITMSQS